jgi:branched-subunit amino acid transport protein
MIGLWLVLFAVGMVTYACRWSWIGWFSRGEIGQCRIRMLRFVPPAAFAALVAPELMLRNGGPASADSYPRILAALVAGLVAWRTRNVLLTVGTGMVVFHIL